MVRTLSPLNQIKDNLGHGFENVVNGRSSLSDFSEILKNSENELAGYKPKTKQEQKLAKELADEIKGWKTELPRMFKKQLNDTIKYYQKLILELKERKRSKRYLP